MSRATFTARDPAHMQPVDDGVPYVLTASERSQAASFALAIERHRRRCNAHDLAISEAQARGELQRAGIVLEDE
jgi:hypothetical protein